MRSRWRWPRQCSRRASTESVAVSWMVSTTTWLCSARSGAAGRGGRRLPERLRALGQGGLPRGRARKLELHRAVRHRPHLRRVVLPRLAGGSARARSAQGLALEVPVPQRPLRARDDRAHEKALQPLERSRGNGRPTTTTLEPIPLGLHARRGRPAAPATAALLSALPVRLHDPAATGIHGLTPSVAHLYRNRLLLKTRRSRAITEHGQMTDGFVCSAFLDLRPRTRS